MELKIHAAVSEWEIDAVRGLFEKYWAQLGFTPCFQDFASELANLPGKYDPPDGRLGLALAGEHPAGCIALRRLDRDTCEVKRLFVDPGFRALGAGRLLLDWAVREARSAGYRTMVGDTLPVMGAALKLYDSYGFERTGAYTGNPTPGAIFIRLRLAP